MEQEIYIDGRTITPGFEFVRKLKIIPKKKYKEVKTIKIFSFIY